MEVHQPFSLGGLEPNQAWRCLGGLQLTCKEQGFKSRNQSKAPIRGGAER